MNFIILCDHILASKNTGEWPSMPYAGLCRYLDVHANWVELWLAQDTVCI